MGFCTVLLKFINFHKQNLRPILILFIFVDNLKKNLLLLFILTQFKQFHYEKTFIYASHVPTTLRDGTSV